MKTYEIALRNNGNMYWFDLYLPQSKVPYALFMELVEYTQSISEQSEKIKLNGDYINPKWVFYYINEDLAERLNTKFLNVHIYAIPYFEGVA